MGDTVMAFPDIAMPDLAATAIPMLTITSANDQLNLNLITDITDTDITHTLTDSVPALLVILLALLILTDAHKVLANALPKRRLLPNTLMVSIPVEANHTSGTLSGELEARDPQNQNLIIMDIMDIPDMDITDMVLVLTLDELSGVLENNL